jgi:hypothetical protein
LNNVEFPISENFLSLKYTRRRPLLRFALLPVCHTFT